MMSNDRKQDEIDSKLEAVANVHRRRLLFGLAASNPISVPQAIPNGGTGGFEDPPPTVEMFHVHLPRLEDSGYIEWNRETDEVTKGPQYEEIAPLLSLLIDNRNELAGDVI